MGYCTEFSGAIHIDPPFSTREIQYLLAFCQSRRMDQDLGPFHVHDPKNGYFHADARDCNKPPPGQPSLNTHWTPSEDGQFLQWDGSAKFSYSAEWLSYFRSYFIVHRAAALIDPDRMGFLQHHRMSGIVHVVGEEADHDLWRIKADDEGIFVSRGLWTDLAMREVFNADPNDKHQLWTDHVSMHVAIEHVVRPAFVSWKPWERIADFTLPHDEALVRAHQERAVLELASPPDNPSSIPTRPTL